MTKSDQSSTSKMCLVCRKQFDASVLVCPHHGTNLVRIGGQDGIGGQDDNFIGKVINEKYKIITKIGQGGMGSVYLAEQLGLDRHVAVKILKAQLSEDKVSVKRFEQEASTSADLSHENLIHLYDYGTFEGRQPYLILEYLEGESLAEILRREGPLEPVRVLHIFSQVMDGLKYAHDKGVVHRDIKPSNIILLNGENGEQKVKIVDFGLAKLMPWSGKESQHLTKTGEVFGSPIYMSPEQCMGKKLEGSSDIYSLGVTIFETLVGTPPFKGKNVVETASQHMHGRPPSFDERRADLNLSDNLQAVVNKALEKEPAHRYLNLTLFKEALTQAIAGPGANGGIRTGPPPERSPDATQPVKRSDLESYKPPTGTHAKKTSDQLRAAQSKPPVHPGLIAAAVGVLAIAGGGAWFVTQNNAIPGAPGEKGYVSYINAVNRDKKNIRIMVEGSTSAKPLTLTDYSECYLGRSVEVRESKHKWIGSKMDMFHPVWTLNRYYGLLSMSQSQSVYNELLTNDMQQIYKGSAEEFREKSETVSNFDFAKSAVVEGFKFGIAKLQPGLDPEQWENYLSNPSLVKLLSGVKLTSQPSKNQVEVVINESAFLKGKANSFKKMILKADDGKKFRIDSISDSTEAEWLNY